MAQSEMALGHFYLEREILSMKNIVSKMSGSKLGKGGSLKIKGGFKASEFKKGGKKK